MLKNWADTYMGDMGASDDEYFPASKRIQMPPGCATFFRNEVFEQVLPRLGKRLDATETEAFYSNPFRKVRSLARKPHYQVIYLALYTACFHRTSKQERLSVADISRATGIDARTVQRDLVWLQESGDIKLVEEGTPKSRSERGKPVWHVPLAKFKMESRRRGGRGTVRWTPVPRFIIEKYVPLYPRAILLPVLQYIQQWQRRRGFYKDHAQRITGWPRRTVFRALETLAKANNWRDEFGLSRWELPCPLEVSTEEFKFRLRFLDTQWEAKRGMTRIALTSEFRKYFAPEPDDDDES